MARALRRISDNHWIEYQSDAIEGTLLKNVEAAGLNPTDYEEVDAVGVINDYISIDASIKYQEDRRSEYPPIGDQLDALFHHGAFPDDMAATLQAVKDKYPKP